MESDAKTPGRELLQSIIDDITSFAVKTLKKGIKEIDKAHSSWEERFESLSKEIFMKNDEGSTGKDKHVPAPLVDESAVEDLLEHIERFNGFDLITFMEKLRNEPAIAPDPDNIGNTTYIEYPLNYEFWKPKPDDTARTKFQKRCVIATAKLDRLAGSRSLKDKKVWGWQRYQPQLLSGYYLLLPVEKKIFELFEKRLREHARQYNFLHLRNEKELRANINAVIYATDGSENAANVSKQPEDEDLKTNSGIKPELSPLKLFTAELKEFITARAEVFLEQSVIAGTRLLKESFFSLEENKRSRDHFYSNCREKAGVWNEYFRAEGDDWTKDLEIIRLQLQTIGIISSTVRQLEKKITGNISPLLDHLLSVVKKSFESIKESEHSPEFRNRILSENRINVRDLRLKSIPGLIDAFSKASFLKSIENYQRQINHKFIALTDDFAILQRLDIESIPPVTSVRHINLKKIIETEYLDPLRKKSDEFTANAEQSLGNILRTLNEIGHMIQLNLESAIELLDDESARSGKKEDAGRMLSEGLDRIFRVIEKIQPETLSIPQRWGREMEEISYAFISGVDELSDNENILNLLIRQTKADAVRHYSGMSRQVARNLKVFFLKIWKILSFGLTGARSGYEQLSRMAGISAITESEQELMNYLFTTRRKIEKLPFVYQRLYRYDALKERSIFIGRSDELDRLDECYQLWKSGNFASVAVIGEKGSGRTSLINIAETDIFKQLKTLRIDLPKEVRTEEGITALFASAFSKNSPARLDELEIALNELSSPVVIAVENLQNIFIRTIRGFDLLERFLLLLSRTPAKVFWVVTCGNYLWNYFDRVVSIKRYFHEVILLNDLPADAAQEIILKRHRMSGYELEFIPGQSELADRRFKRLSSESNRQDYLRAVYFKRLHELARGNISSALLLWQLSVDSIKPNKVVIGNELYFDYSFLNLLSEDELFTLEALVESEVLSIAEHAEIFHHNIRMSELILLRMKNKGILVQAGAGFHIHFGLYKQILKVLDDRNILK